MASEADHINLANHNHEMLMHLLKDADAFPDWLATVAFYKAVHVVEAVFANNLPAHSATHSDREATLKLSRYRGIAKDYGHLATTSRIARYLGKSSGAGYSKFTDYMDADAVKRLIRKRLYGVEQKSLPFLSDAARKALLKIEPRRIV